MTPPLDRFSEYRDTSLDETQADVEHREEIEAEKADAWYDGRVDREEI